jgi:hypothetical protein
MEQKILPFIVPAPNNYHMLLLLVWSSVHVIVSNFENNNAIKIISMFVYCSILCVEEQDKE